MRPARLLLSGNGGGDAFRFVDWRRLDAEGVGKTNEKTEERRHICCLGYLLLRPADVAKRLDLLVCDSVGGLAYGTGKFQEQPFWRKQVCGVEVAVAQCIRDPLEMLALQLQEPRVGAESIPAAIEGGDVGGDHLVLRSG